MSSLQGYHQLVRTLEQLSDQLWRHDLNTFDATLIDGITQRAAQLNVEFKLQQVLDGNVALLRVSNEVSRKKMIPKLQGVVGFIFTALDPGGLEYCRENERQQRLRQLDPLEMILCGVCYTHKELVTMAPQRFDILITNIPRYIQARNIVEYLMHKDIVSSVVASIDEAEDEDAFHKFITLLFNQRSRKRKRDAEIHAPNPIIHTDRGHPHRIDGEFSLAGEVCPLSIDRIKSHAEELYNQAGEPNLTFPFNTEVFPFINIPIANAFAIKLRNRERS